MKATDLSALIASRLCHDLVSPVGAISNGLEIIAEEDDPGMIRQAVDLLNLSVRQAEYKLAFYRLAFGASASAAGAFSSRDIAAAAADFLGEERVQLDWGGEETSLGKTQTRMMANLILLAHDCLPRGGRLTVDYADRHMTIMAEGQGCRVRDEVSELLRGTGEPPMPHLAPAALLKALVSEAGARLRLTPAEGRVDLEIAFS